MVKTSACRIGILGGTGAEGRGLALRWADAGHDVTIGGRDSSRAQEIAAQLTGRLGGTIVNGRSNLDAAEHADIVVLTVPYAARGALITEVRHLLTDKLLIDTTVPLRPPQVGVVHLPAAGSAAKELQALTGPAVRVVSAFQNVAAACLDRLGHPPECDVMVSADDPADAERVVVLAEDAGMRGFHVGPLANAAVAEGLTSILIGLNRRQKVTGAGIRFTGLGDKNAN